MNEDLIVFKFSPINKYLIESLVNPSLYFAKPNMLNDPFDCHIDLHRALKRASQTVTGERQAFLKSILEDANFWDNWNCLFSNVGVCSFSSVTNETLLWSHYADDHKGVCLLYQLPKSVILDEKLQLTAGGEVSYYPEPLTEWLQNAPIEINDFVRGLIHIFLKTKSPAWKYEKEVRLIRREHGIFDIPGECMTQVCFGLNTSQADISLVVKLANEYCGCKNFGQMVRDESEFGFTMKPLAV